MKKCWLNLYTFVLILVTCLIAVVCKATVKICWPIHIATPRQHICHNIDNMSSLNDQNLLLWHEISFLAIKKQLSLSFFKRSCKVLLFSENIWNEFQFTLLSFALPNDIMYEAWLFFAIWNSRVWGWPKTHIFHS